MEFWFSRSKTHSRRGCRFNLIDNDLSIEPSIEMRMTPEEKQELDAWAEKEYPKSMERIDALNSYHHVGKKILFAGILSYVVFVIIDMPFLKTLSIIFLLLGMLVETFALIAYFKTLSNDK